MGFDLEEIQDFMEFDLEALPGHVKEGSLH